MELVIRFEIRKRSEGAHKNDKCCIPALGNLEELSRAL
jgi:hypothetical protein